MRRRSKALRVVHSCSGACDSSKSNFRAPVRAATGTPVAERDPGGCGGGDAVAEGDDAGEVQRVRRAQGHDGAVRRGAAHPSQGLHRLGQGVLLAGEARDEPPPADLAACFEAAEHAQQVPPRDGERFAREERLEHDAVTAQQGARDGLGVVLPDAVRLHTGGAARNARPPAGLGDGVEAANGGAGERAQPREPVRAHEPVGDQLAERGGRVRRPCAGSGEEVVEERRAAGAQA